MLICDVTEPNTLKEARLRVTASKSNVELGDFAKASQGDRIKVGVQSLA